VDAGCQFLRMFEHARQPSRERLQLAQWRSAGACPSSGQPTRATGRPDRCGTGTGQPMSQSVVSQDTPSSLTGLLVPLADRTLLLPNVAVAELVPYRAPRTAEGAPSWFLGQVAWRGLSLPLLSFEAASNGVAAPDPGAREVQRAAGAAYSSLGQGRCVPGAGGCSAGGAGPGCGQPGRCPGAYSLSECIGAEARRRRVGLREGGFQAASLKWSGCPMML